MGVDIGSALAWVKPSCLPKLGQSGKGGEAPSVLNSGPFSLDGPLRDLGSAIHFL